MRYREDASLDTSGVQDRRGGGRGRAAAIGDAPVVVPVHAGNAASAGVLRAAGFSVVTEADLEPDNPADDRRHVVYRLDLDG